MPYDEGLAERIREHFRDRSDVAEKRMFGGLCFMVAQHMCCGIVKDSLMARVGPDRYAQCLGRAHVSEMDFTGKPMNGFVFVAAEGLESDQDLADWLEDCTAYITTLPAR